MNTTTHIPKVAYRVLATDWEGETFTECWTELADDADRIAAALRQTHESVQVDKVVKNAK